MKYSAPTVVQIVPKHGLNDCMVAALASYLCKPYEEVVAACGRIAPGFVKSGLDNDEAQRVARRLKFKTKWVRDYEMDEDTGVLTVKFNVGGKHHAVLLLDGRIFDLEDRPVVGWEPAAYMLAANVTPNLLLVQTDLIKTERGA